MTPEERTDKMVEQAQAACETETGRRLFLACCTDALITRILAIQDLSGVADEVAEALAKARKEASAQPMTTTEQ